MADKDTGNSDEQTQETAENGSEEQSFRERVEEIREKRTEEGDGEGEPPESPFAGGGSPGMGGGGMMGGGNPMAQMMGGMMGGGPGGPPSGAGGEEASNKELVSEVRQLRDELRDQARALKRIADAIEDS